MMMPSFEGSFRVKKIFLIISLVWGGAVGLTSANEGIEFNTDVLDVNDRDKVDLSKFSKAGYIMPGKYSMLVRINDNEIADQEIYFYSSDDEESGSRACISKELTSKLGLKEKLSGSLLWWHNGQCLDEKSLKGVESKGELSTSTLYINIPQAYLEYSSENWDPPSQWDEGIAGFLFDYNINAKAINKNKGIKSYDLSGNGTIGANMDAWRFRADWQGVVNRFSGRKEKESGDNSVQVSRYYAYRAIPELNSVLTLGEDYLNSGVFDSFRFTGGSLVSDDNMLPPNLRGYAPEVVGVAKTNAKVTISQLGRVVYETQVAAGPFRIQDINDAVSGELLVRIEEQNGSVQEFKMDTSTIPYLTRPGTIRYRMAVGKPSLWKHRAQGPIFGTGEFSWGVSNGWSLYGGALLGDDYSAVSLGVGRDLLMLGAISFDATQSRSHMKDAGGNISGGSYRVSYSKTFEEIDSQVTFAGYRFSDKNFMSMNEYIDAAYYGGTYGNQREMYVISFNKQFRDLGFSTYLNYSHQTYWDRPENDRYNITASRYFDVGQIKNVSLSVSAYRNRYNYRNDDGIYLSLSMPWGDNKNISYSTSVANKQSSHRVGLFNRIDEHNNYQFNVGNSRKGGSISGYYNHDNDFARMSANVSYNPGDYSAVGISAQGGVTVTSEGGGLHRSNIIGGTRLLVDTGGVPGIPVRGYGSTVRTNRFGKAILSDVNSYYRNKANIDLNNLGSNAEATKSVVQATLTEGAIGYRKFDLIAGKKAMGVVTLKDGSQPPFGAIVTNAKKQETGIINDDGQVYLIGITPGSKMSVSWNGAEQCQIEIPEHLTQDMLYTSLLLPCK